MHSRFFPVVAAFYIIVIAGARPVTMVIFVFALALLITLRTRRGGIFGWYDHFTMEIYRLRLFRVKTIISPFYRVALDVFPNLQIIFFAANHMVVEQLLPNRMTYLLCDIALHLLNNG